MTILLPGMTEDDQRVKVSSCDTLQQGLLDSWKTKVCINTALLCLKFEFVSSNFDIAIHFPYSFFSFIVCCVSMH